MIKVKTFAAGSRCGLDKEVNTWLRARANEKEILGVSIAATEGDGMWYVLTVLYKVKSRRP